MNFLTKFRIPTLLGLLLIIGGMAGGIYLVLQNQTLQTKASANLIPQNVEVTNIEDLSFAVSWQTAQAVIGFLVVNMAGSDQTILDDQDPVSPKPRTLHHASVKNLTPQTTYQYRIVSGKLKLPFSQITTTSTDSPNGSKPIIGQIFSANHFLQNGLVFLEITGAIKQSTVIKDYGNFVIPISQISKSDLSRVFIPDDQTIGKITIIDESLQETNITFYLKDSLPPIQAGGSVNLTQQPLVLGETVSQFDLNKDGQINSSDYSIVLRNFGRNPKDPKADLNSDGIVDQKDLGLIQKQINQ